MPLPVCAIFRLQSKSHAGPGEASAAEQQLEVLKKEMGEVRREAAASKAKLMAQERELGGGDDDDGGKCNNLQLMYSKAVMVHYMSLG